MEAIIRTIVALAADVGAINEAVIEWQVLGAAVPSQLERWARVLDETSDTLQRELVAIVAKALKLRDGLTMAGGGVHASFEGQRVDVEQRDEVFLASDQIRDKHEEGPREERVLGQSKHDVPLDGDRAKANRTHKTTWR